MSLYPCSLHTSRVLYGRETLVEPVICLKKLITVAFGSSEPFHLVNGRVRVGAIPIKESTDSLITTLLYTCHTKHTLL